MRFIDLPLRFVMAFLAFTFTGWIGWLGIVLVLLRVFGVINWPWWLAALPLEYGVIYCLYMTIDGARYRAGSKDIGAYARFTQGELADEVEAWNELEDYTHKMKRKAGTDNAGDQ